MIRTIAIAFVVAASSAICMCGETPSSILSVAATNAPSTWDDVEDPADALFEMMRSRSYRGCWGGGDMFDKFTIAFDPDGNGFFSACMFASPFLWTADTNGTIEMTIPLQYGETTNFIAHYDAATDILHLQKLGKAKRNWERDSEHPARDMFDEIFKKINGVKSGREMELARNNLMLTNESARIHFDDLESALSWLQTPGDSNCVYRQIMFESISTNWLDSIAYEPTIGFLARIATGYFERGEQPLGAELSAMMSEQTKRPYNLPPPQVENLNGIEDVERACAGHDKAYIDRMSLQRNTFWKYSCVDIVNVGFKGGDAKVFAEMLRPRFGHLFPRDAQTSTARKRRVEGK